MENHTRHGKVKTQKETQPMSMPDCSTDVLSRDLGSQCPQPCSVSTEPTTYIGGSIAKKEELPEKIKIKQNKNKASKKINGLIPMRKVYQR